MPMPSATLGRWPSAQAAWCCSPWPFSGRLAGAYVLWLHLVTDPIADVRAYYDAATRLNHGQDLYIAYGDPSHPTFYFYPPLLAILMRPFAAALPFHVFAVGLGGGGRRQLREPAPPPRGQSTRVRRARAARDTARLGAGDRPGPGPPDAPDGDWAAVVRGASPPT